MANLSLVFDLIAKDKASKEFRDVGDAADKTGGKLDKIGKIAAGVALGGVVALGAGLVSVFKGGIEEMNANETALAQFSAGLKSTGNVAGISATQMQTLADSIEAKTGTDGAAVVSGGALLATFTKVRNEVGKGNDVFNRATQAGVDLAARGFGSVEGNAIMLGKALQDPIKGITALARSGVTFTEAQKETIKALVATGDTLGAQKIILAEVEGQVGGSAAAYGQTLPGQIARARHAFDGIKETVVKALMPAFTAMLEYVVEKILPGFERLVARLSDTEGTFQKKIVPAVAATIEKLKSLGEFIKRNEEVIVPLVAALGTLAAAIGIVSAATKAYTAIQVLLNVALAANPIGVVVLALVAITAGLVTAYKTSDTFRAAVDKAWAKIKEFAGSIDDLGAKVDRWVIGKFKDAKGKLDDFVDAMKGFKLPGWVSTLGDALGAIGGGLGKGFAALRGGVGDGPGKSAGGKTLSRIQSLLPRGAYITSTLRSAAENARVGGSPTSYHMDRNNPAVDIGGSTAVLNALHARLKAIGGWRELLWKVPGHFDHIHVAHSGGQVDQSWARMPGDAANERTVRTQVGETILAAGDSGRLVALLESLVGLNAEQTRQIRDLTLQLEANDRRTRVGG